MIVEIKQIAIDNPNQRKYSSPYGEFTMEPMSSRSYRVEKGIDGRFITGLTQEQEERLGRILNKDLSNTSDFWTKVFRMSFQLNKGSMSLDSRDPYSEIFIAAAKANDRLAESKDALLDDVLLKRRTIFYINNKEEQEKKKVSLIELRDEVGSLLFQSKNNRDKLFWISNKIGLNVTKQYKEESMYNMISTYREKLTTKEKLEDFRAVLKLSNTELQAGYYVNIGLSKGLISIDKETNQFRFLDQQVGKRQEDVNKFFSSPKNESHLAMLINEIDG